MKQETKKMEAPESVKEVINQSEYITLSIKKKVAEKVRQAMIEEKFQSVNEFLEAVTDARLEMQAEIRSLMEPDNRCHLVALTCNQHNQEPFTSRAIAMAREMVFLYPEEAHRYGLEKFI